MSERTVEDYLKEGIYGPKEIKPEEKRLYLGTFRERVIVALTKFQVGKQNVYKEVIKKMSDNRDAQLLLNGHMDYPFLSKYIKHANKLGIQYTVVTNKEYNSEYGLVLAKEHSVNVDNILINDKKDQQDKKEEKKQSFFKRLFGRK